MTRVSLATLLSVLFLASPAVAAQCGGDFHQFIASMSREAAAAGVSQNVIANAFAGVTQDQAVLAFDRRQRGTFNKTFEQYVATRVGRRADQPAASNGCSVTPRCCRGSSGSTACRRNCWSRSGG